MPAGELGPKEVQTILGRLPASLSLVSKAC